MISFDFTNEIFNEFVCRMFASLEKRRNKVLYSYLGVNGLLAYLSKKEGKINKFGTCLTLFYFLHYRHDSL